MTHQTVLLIGELGTGLGHIMPLFRIAEALHDVALAADQTLRCVYAVHSPDLVHPLKRKGDLALRAPRAPAQGDLKSHTASYAEMLIVSGFANLDDLRCGVANWDDLFSLVSPDLIIADHSPTAILAARGRIPTFVVGNGFTVPPATLQSYPALMAGRSAPAIQTALCTHVNAILTDRGVPTIKHLPEFLEGDARAVFSLPGLDPYGALRETPLLGLYEDGLEPFPPSLENRLFLYGHTSVPDFTTLIKAALATELPISAYLSGNNAEMSYLLKSQGAEVFDTPPALSDILPRTRLVVSNGGAGLSQAALVAGCPQIIYPIHTESQMTAQALHQMGCAAVLDAACEPTMDALILAAASDATLLQSCQQTAHVLHKMLPKNPLTRLAETAWTLMTSA